MNYALNETIHKLRISMVIWTIVAISQIIAGIVAGIHFFLFFVIIIFAIFNIRTVSVTSSNIRYFRDNPQDVVPYFQRNKGSYTAAMIWDIIAGLLGLATLWFIPVNIIFVILDFVGGIWDRATVSYVLDHADDINQSAAQINSPDSTYSQTNPYTSQESAVVPGDGQWVCKRCGRVNPSYTGTCACGMTKQRNSIDETIE